MRIVLALLATTAVAHAQPTDIVTRPLGLAPGQIGADLALLVDLEKQLEGDTVIFSPDVWVGLPRGVTVGIAHSEVQGLCIRREHLAYHRPCDRAYHGAALDVRIARRLGAFDVAPRVRLMLRDVDPYEPALAIGAMARWTRGRFAIWTDAYLRLGLANTQLGNRTHLALPVWFGVQPSRRTLLAFRTGISSDLATIVDGYRAPAMLLASARVARDTLLSVEAGILSAFGPQNTTGFRSITVSLSFRN